MTASSKWARMSRVQLARKLRRAPEDVRRAALRVRFRWRADEFLRYCFPETFDRPFNEMHRDMLSLGERPAWNERPKPDALHAIAAPRGDGKSTLASFGLLIHAIVYDLEAFIVLVSSGSDLAVDLSVGLKAAFERAAENENHPLTKLYGPFRLLGGKKQWEISVDGRPTVAVKCASLGSSLRGFKHPSRLIRPTLWVLDDAEDKHHVKAPEQRAKWEDTLQKDILKAGDQRRGDHYWFVGTILDVDAVLARREDDPGWEFRKYKAVVQWPTHPDAAGLWERCRQIWSDLTLRKARRSMAFAFYEQHRAVMDEGAEMLSDGPNRLFELYEIIWAQGYGSFLQEYQNDPVDPTTQIFRSSAFAYFDLQVAEDGQQYLRVTHGEQERVVWVRDLRAAYLRWDPATGDPFGDFAAIAVVARDRYGYRYVLDCWIGKAPPSQQAKHAWTLAERWNVRRGSLESNGFQKYLDEPFRRERKRRKAAGEFWQLKLDLEPSTTDKEERIGSTEPDIMNGWVVFNRNVPMELRTQYDQFPNAANDDGPDAVEGGLARVRGPVRVRIVEAA